MTCKDCLYSPMCEYAERHSLINEYCDMFICSEFEDKSQYIKLPCKVGDVVYVPDEDDDYVFPVQIDSIIVSDMLNGEICLQYNGCFYNDDGDSIQDFEFDSDDFGKTVFLTYEEAEKALEEAKKK